MGWENSLYGTFNNLRHFGADSEWEEGMAALLGRFILPWRRGVVGYVSGVHGWIWGGGGSLYE